jgi:hypothetical protein
MRIPLKKSTIILVELGMFAGVIVCFYPLPAKTPLSVFLVASLGCIVLGNFLLFRRAREAKSGKEGFWLHILRALAVLAICWLLVFLLSKH